MNYEAPKIEVIEIEVEDAVLSASGNSNIRSVNDGGRSW